MLKEALTYFWTRITSDSPGWAFRHGFAKETIGIEARYERCKEAWQPHLERCKTEIISIAKVCPQKRTALIVGSGPGLDLPLEALAREFSRIILFDAVHPQRIRKRAKKIRKETGRNIIQFVTGDITEIGDDLDHFTQDTQIPTPSLYHGFPDIDLVISLNIASQLPLRPLSAIPLQYQNNIDISNQIGKNIISAHLNWLAQFESQKILICDRQWLIKENMQGRIIERTDPTFGAKLPQPDKIWTWEVCPNKEMPDPSERKAGFSRENIVGIHSFT